MGYQFNAITGKLDLVGSGGSATTDASLLTSGTLADARLSSNVSLDNIDNNFTSGQTITAAANTSALTASYSVTGANTTPLLDLSGTWNTTGVANGIRLNITDTASAATSRLFEVQQNSISRFTVFKDGTVSIGVGTTPYSITPTNSSFIFAISGIQAGSFRQSGLHLANTHTVAWGGAGVGSSFQDLILARDAAATLAQRSGTTANTFRLYGTFTDLNNGRRLDITSTTGGVFTLTATGNGTGASGNILKLTAPVLIPASSVTLATNGDLAFEATSNTSLTIRYRGSDGTTRSASLTLA
jgi:hypothetical protein